MLKALTRPGVLIPLLLSAALLAFVFSISDVPVVMDRIRGIPVSTMVFCFALALTYVALKGALFHLFLVQIPIRATLRQTVLAFAIGEMTITLPAGIYSQNYVLRRIARADFSRSAAATTALLAVEGAISLTILLMLGLPGLAWLRPAILGLFVVAAVAVFALLKVELVRTSAASLIQAGRLRWLGAEFIEMVEALGRLFVPRIVVRAIPVVTAYLLALLAAFYLVAQGVGLTSINLDQAVTIYLFALDVELLIPLSTHLGVIEGAGLVSMEAWGYGPTEALALFLGFRLVWMGSIWLACGAAALLLRSEFEVAE